MTRQRIFHAYMCPQCNAMLHPQQVSRGVIVETRIGWYYEENPYHVLLVQDYIGAPIRRLIHGVVPR